MGASTGTVYDGLGNRLKGDGRGPKSALGLMGTIKHKALLHDAPSDTGTVEFIESDRIYLVPDEFEKTKWLPLPWMAELAQVLTQGGRVAIIAHKAKALESVVKFLRNPDTVLALSRQQAKARQAQEVERTAQSVGMLCDGNGNYLDGDAGKAVAWQADETQQFRGFINGRHGAAGRSILLPTDRLYIMPADYVVSRVLPVWIIAEMMKTLYSGGKILAIAPDEESFNRLVKILSEPEKLMLAVEPVAGHA